ncbi:MAG: hypothetical protein F6K30_25730 [Cyanothece sp. SIO2G6]|nr:hypothetical protein [Cyanothece sp. SIO2G6]
MMEIYIVRHADEVMEVQNWATLADTDYGVMVMRSLSASERERYFSLKQTLNMRDSEIWRVFHPSGITPPPPPPLPPEEVKIGSCELSKRALLRVMQKACGRDIEMLQHMPLDDLQVLAANATLPPEGVPVLVIPMMPQSA